MNNENEELEIENQVDGESGQETSEGSAPAVGKNSQDKSKAWLSTFPMRYREKLGSKFDSLEAMMDFVMKEEAVAKKVEAPTTTEKKEEKPVEKSLEQQLRELWGDDNMQPKFEQAKKGIAELKKKHPEVAKHLAESGEIYSAGVLNIMSVLTDEPVNPVSKRTSPTDEDQNYKGVKNRYGIPNL